MRLKDKYALVTGSTKGLGQRIAVALAREGATVAVTGLEDPTRVLDAVASAGGRAKYVGRFDLRSRSEVLALWDAVASRFPRVDILVNNAGYSLPRPFWEVTPQELGDQMAVNFEAAFLLAQAAARQMIRHGGGRVVNISTSGAQQTHGDRVIYNAAKAAQEAMTQSLASEGGRYGILCNAVAPGPIANEPDQLQINASTLARRRSVPLGRVGEPEDIAEAVLFFCLPESKYITGQVLLVDGGRSAQLPRINPTWPEE
ncbi:MAG TPA: SDR family oxidoreductase [Symbiobacteriaceae bacterium]|nr:SDR family oxidoreductase [Symbiobacteriaceae bacterium]